MMIDDDDDDDDFSDRNDAESWSEGGDDKSVQAVWWRRLGQNQSPQPQTSCQVSQLNTHYALIHKSHLNV